MFFAPRIGLKPLAQLCRRLAVTTGAGLEDRRIWRDEAQRGGRSQQAAVARVSHALDRGESIGAALAHEGDYFPPLFRHVVAIGDHTGRLDKTYRRLADHYEHMIATRRTLLSALSWPGIQLAIAVLTIGAVIWLTSMLNLRSLDEKPLDIFGLGLTGPWGLVVYCAIVITGAIAGLLFMHAWSRGVLWTGAMQRAALKIPAIGDAAQTLALARITWALNLVLDTPLDLRKALPLAMDASGNAAYRQLGPRIANNIGRGMTLHAALAETGEFPRDFLDAVSVGEQSGLTAETMERLARDYQQRAMEKLGLLARIVGGIVWALVALLIIMMIFRGIGSYPEMIKDLSKPGGGI
jgi:type II secretory pathway component PulF